MNSWKVQKGVMMQETSKKHEWLTFYHTPTLFLGRRKEYKLIMCNIYTTRNAYTRPLV